MDWRLQTTPDNDSGNTNFVQNIQQSYSFTHVQHGSTRARRNAQRRAREQTRRNERKCCCCLTPSFTHRREGCLWKTFSWVWIIVAFPLKLIETVLVGHPMMALQRLVKHHHWKFVSGMIYAWCWIMALIYPIHLYNPAKACPIYTSSALWCSSHLFVRLIFAQLEPQHTKLLNWSAPRHRRSLYGLVPIHIAYYAGLCACMVLVYPMFTHVPSNEQFLTWCSLTPTWELPNGVMFTLTIVIAQFAALIQVTNPTRQVAPRWTQQPTVPHHYDSVPSNYEPTPDTGIHRLPSDEEQHPADEHLLDIIADTSDVFTEHEDGGMP